MKPNSKFCRLKFFNLSRVLLFSWLIVSSCQNESSRSRNYYYSDEGLENSLPDTTLNIDLADKKSVTHYIKNKTFVSKTQKLVVNDSLQITLFVNGKKESVMNCEVTEYMVHNDRLLIFTDAITSKQAKFTISTNGVITDMKTYALYSVRE